MPIRSNRKTETYYDQFSRSGDVAQSPYPWIFPFGDRALFLGGQGGSPQENQNWIDYLNITTTGDAADFGNLLAGNRAIFGCSSSQRGLVAGGADSPNNIIQYNTIATLGNSIDFGDLTQARIGASAAASKTRGVFAGGQAASPGSIPGGSGVENTIDYVTIDTTGDASDFGDLPASRSGCYGSSNGTIGYFFGGDDGNESDSMYAITIATTGNASSLGRLDPSGNQGAKAFGGAASDATRIIIAGGRCNNSTDGHRTDQIEYFDYGSSGNTINFGDLRAANFFCTGTTSNSTRAVISGGDAGGSVQRYIDYITIQSTGNASDFGDLYNHSGAAPRMLHAAYSGQA